MDYSFLLLFICLLVMLEKKIGHFYILFHNNIDSRVFPVNVITFVVLSDHKDYISIFFYYKLGKISGWNWKIISCKTIYHNNNGS
jgi:hypothetical protein